MKVSKGTRAALVQRIFELLVLDTYTQEQIYEKIKEKHGDYVWRSFVTHWADAQELYAKHVEQLSEKVSQDTIERKLAAIRQLPTRAELMLELYRSCDVENPKTVGFTVKTTKDGDVVHIPTFPTQGFRLKAFEQIAAYLKDVEQDGDTDKNKAIETIEWKIALPEPTNSMEEDD